jgi:hypothetical protein
VAELGSDAASQAHAAALVACVNGVRGSGFFCCDAPRCARKASADSLLQVCGCCGVVALCGICAVEIYGVQTPKLHRVMEERIERGDAPVCGACIGNVSKDEEWYTQDTDARMEAETAAVAHEACLKQRDSLVAAGYGDKACRAAAARGAALLPGMLVFMPERKPAALAVVLSVGPTAARIGIMPAADSFTCESGHFVKEEERALDAGVVALSHLKDVSASNARLSVFGYHVFRAFGVVGYGAGFQKAGFPSAFLWGDPCELEEGYSLKSVPADVQFTFSGVVKTTNGARSVVLLCTLETALTIVVLPYGVISMRTGVSPAEPRGHMATL